MNEKDKRDRKDNAVERQAPRDQTLFRNSAPAGPASKAAESPSTKSPSDATNVRGAATEDATRVKPGPQARGEPGGMPSEQTRVRPGGKPGAAPNTSMLDIERHRVLKGRFTLEKVIGVGGMGVVYRALDRLKVEAHDREPYVAIKVLSEEFKTHPESFVALQRESRKTQRIAHPNVVKVFDFDRDGDVVFMTMEYMEGRSLDRILAQHSVSGLPQADVWHITHGLCSALIHAHEENIVHSDFKPGNIFITNAGMPKIFDFGIARAVAVIDRKGSGTRDVTVFDAGSLGALTPAYASLEMLLGEEPDVRDDIYALGCIVYEMLTGQHPFGRLPADEARTRGLKPKKISDIKRGQWKALEKALAFKREERAASVAEFYEALLSTRKPPYVIAGATILIIAAIAMATYFIVTRPSPEAQSDIQLGEIEFGIRYNLFKEKIQKLIADAQFTEAWEAALWEEVSNLKTLLAGREDKWFADTFNQIYEMYVNAYKAHLEKKDFARAATLLTNAYRYATDTRYLDAEKARLADLLHAEEERKKAFADERTRVAQVREADVQEQQKRTDIFNLALRNVNQQLRCEGNLSMRDLGIAVDKLRSVDRVRYNTLEQNIVMSLAACITNVGKVQPERATEAKTYALRIFPNNALIAGIKVVPRDACSRSLAGLGARDTAVCRDRIPGIGPGPAMVVIPTAGGTPAFAIGKYEISMREIDQFCNATKACKPLGGEDDAIPATNIGVNTASEYVRWLSRVTNQRYRLPTRTEWMYAAKANGHSGDPNRNCAFNTRGIEKGGQLVRVNVGAQNGWGLVNYLGNCQEWAYDRSQNLMALGGSYGDAMERCSIDSAIQHSGEPDAKTGFRVVREIRQNNE